MRIVVVECRSLLGRGHSSTPPGNRRSVSGYTWRHAHTVGIIVSLDKLGLLYQRT